MDSIVRNRIAGFRCPPVVIAVTVLALALAGCAKRIDAPAASTPSSAPAPAGGSSAVSPTAPTSPPPPTPEAASVPPPPAFVSNEALKDVHFGSGKRDVLGTDRAQLNSVAGWLHANPNWLLLIEGHTDDRGSWQQNLIISEERAQAVMRTLVAQGVNADRITNVGFGADRPICRDRTEKCRAQNRRVHFQVRPR